MNEILKPEQILINKCNTLAVQVVHLEMALENADSKLKQLEQAFQETAKATKETE